MNSVNDFEKNDVIFFVCHSILMCAKKILIFSVRLRQGFCNALYLICLPIFIPRFPNLLKQRAGSTTLQLRDLQFEAIPVQS